MRGDDRLPGEAGSLRGRAEARIRERGETAPEDLGPADARALIHELRTHQIELELQNEELRRAQVELDAARARYFDLYDLAPVGYCTVGEAGRIQEVNLTAAQLLGVARGALVDQPFTRFVLTADQDDHYLRLRRLLQSGTPQAYDLRLVRADGKVFWAHLQAALAPGEAGCRIVLSDATARKQAEADRARLEEQLEEARRMEAIGRLAGGVAHEFNNMMGVVLGTADLALAQLAPEQPLHADLLEIRQAARRSADLTQQLLAFSRRQLIDPRVIDLNATAEPLLTLLGRLVGEGVTLDWQPQPALWPVFMDPAQVHQILTHLCVNARDAIQGPGQITLGTANQRLSAAAAAALPGLAAGEYVRLFVRDSGCGLDRETRAHLFEPFFATKGVGQGTGLGLSAIHGIVKQNGGAIQVRSAPGEETTFEIYLPRHAGIPEPARLSPPTPKAATGHETILLVEDEGALLQLTARVLTQLGYTVLSAGSPSAALRLAREHAGELHLLLTDVVMPGMNGRDLARGIRAALPGIRCLFMSGYPAEIIAQDGLLEEGVAFLQKPFTLGELAGQVREALDLAPTAG